MQLTAEVEKGRAVAANLQCAYLHGQIEVTYGKKQSDSKFMPTETMVGFIAFAILQIKTKKNSNKNMYLIKKTTK